MNDLYNAADIIVIPSLREGLGFSAIEGMLLKKPIIASNTIGLNEIVIPNKTGITFKVGDSDDLSKKIIWSLRNPKKIKQIAEKGYKWQVNKFTTSEMAKKHILFYQEIMSM